MKRFSLMKARDEYPGTLVPDMMNDPLKYHEWWGRMVMWGYKFGPYLLSLEDKHEETGSGGHRNGRAG